jgi:hypothetical protein
MDVGIRQQRSTMTRYYLRGITLPLSYDLHSGLNTIGRNPTNDFRVSEVSVSSFHCEVEVLDSGVFVRDLQSTNGTFINDQPVEQAQLLQESVLQLGTVTFRLEAVNVEIRVPQVTIVAAPEPKQPLLEDGRAACCRNPQIPATHHCVQCSATFHVSNIRGMRLSGGTSGLLFCPDCNGACEAIPGAMDPVKSKSLLGRLTQTVMLGWKRK